MPARLVYAPKVWAFTRQHNGTILNLTDYLTGGQVQRVVDQASTASLTLRNPNKMFTIPKSPAFLPMDGLTIWLQRLAGFPVQVFTGYLDETPYYQMYPGTITLNATCTLKRLIYSYFDASLPSVNTWLQKYGWINTGTGQALSTQGFGSQATIAQGKAETLVDGGIAKLLWAALVDFGDWKDTNIWIERLPGGDTGIAARMAKLIGQSVTANNDQTQAFAQFLHTVVGAGAQGTGGGVAGGGTVNSSQLNANQNTFASIVSTVTGLDPNVVAAWVISEEPSSSAQAPNGANNWLNIFAFDSGNWSTHGGDFSTPTAGAQTTVKFLQGSFGGASIGIQNILKTAGQSPQQQIAAIQQSGWASSGYPNLPSVYQQIVSSGGTGSSTGKTGQTGNSISTTNPQGLNTVFFPFPSGAGYAAEAAWSQDQGVDISAPGDTPELAMAAGTVVKHGISGFGNWAPVLKLDNPIQGQSYIYYGHAGPNGLAAVGTHLVAGQQITSVYNGVAGISTGPHLEIGFCDANGSPVPSTSSLMLQTLKSAQKGLPVPGGSPGNTPNDTTAATDNVLSVAKAVAFTGELNWPTVQDMVTAEILGQYKRGLMHDQQLLPFIQQLSNSSLRHFQSLPNGDFFAFYPDYFGETGHRKPYWTIDDIEILTGDIYLNDQTLVTHEYAVGDNLYPINDALLNDLSSAGAINIFNAFLQSDLLNTDGPNAAAMATGGTSDIMDHNTALAFLQRYGVRPKVDNFPMIRSTVFEMFMAYQQFMLAWAGQFRTNFSFTFMPELYPGGKVAFPGQGLMMYINSVTHTWDYTEGFTTDAELMAPSKWGPDNPDLPPNMVQAMTGPVTLARGGKGNSGFAAPNAGNRSAGQTGTNTTARNVAKQVGRGIETRIGNLGF